MATSHGGMLDLSGKQNLLLDLLAIAYLPWFAAIHYGFVSSEINAFGGYDLSGTLWTVAGIDISVSLLFVVFGFAWILGTNELDGAEYSSEYIAVIVLGLAAPILHVFVPAFADLVNMNGFSQLFFTVYTSLTATAVGYMN